jgi:tetratricopeptide (TPR) repeat protein
MTEPHTSSTPAAASDELATVRQRLDRLEGFLQVDPGNPALRVDAFETALRCKEWDRASAHLRQGQSQPGEALSWALKEGDFWLAQKRYEDARGVLQGLAGIEAPPPGFADVVLHNLAYIDFCERRFDTCIARLAPRMEPADMQPVAAGTAGPAPVRVDSATEPALQQLWLRALHHAGDLDRASQWVRWAEQAGQLDARAAGVASLIALDNNSVDMAQRWSLAALASRQPQDRPVEALVTQASIALAGQDAQAARQLADAALRFNPDDGRAWSARAFADLLAGELPTAQAHFKRALATMPSHIGTWHGQAWTQLLMQDLAAAQASFEHALSLDRNFAESHGGLAVALVLSGQEAAAREHIERAMRLDRSNLSGQYAQALLSGEARNAAAVQRLAKRLLGGRAGPLGGSMADWLGGRPTQAGTDDGSPAADPLDGGAASNDGASD